jgi:hypothetical protein
MPFSSAPRRVRLIAALALILCGVAALALARPGEGRSAIATQSAQECVYDGTSSRGVRTGSNPVRYEFGNSPYLGIRYDRCRETIKFFVGGYERITHYNLRVSFYDARTGRGQYTVQRELSAGLRKTLTWSSDGNAGQMIIASAQACNRGGLFQRSSCTRLSPPVRIAEIFRPGG